MSFTKDGRAPGVISARSFRNASSPELLSGVGNVASKAITRSPASARLGTRRAYVVLRRSFQSSSSLALVTSSFFVAAGIKALICPAGCPRRAVHKQQAAGTAKDRGLQQFDVSACPRGFCSQSRSIFDLRELCRTVEESQRSRTLGVTSVVARKSWPVRQAGPGQPKRSKFLSCKS
jgi:hypothetical protein